VPLGFKIALLLFFVAVYAFCMYKARHCEEDTDDSDSV
jgi:hypothetical protein